MARRTTEGGQVPAGGVAVTSDDLREALSTLGWSQRDAAHQLEVAPRLMRYYAAGDERYPIPYVVEAAIRWCLHMNRH